MSDHVTEIAYLYLVAGTDVRSGDAKRVWQESLKTVAAQKGCNSIFWGMQIENKDVAQLVIDWDSLEAHKKFMESDAYQPFLKTLYTLLSSDPHLFHARLPASPSLLSNPFTCPVTECFHFYFPADYPESAFNTNYQNFVDAAKTAPNEAQGLTAGWSVEEQVHANLGKEGEEGKGKMFAGFVGWPSVEAHVEFQNSEAFGSVVGHLAEGPVGSKVHHVVLEKFEG